MRIKEIKQIIPAAGWYATYSRNVSEYTGKPVEDIEAVPAWGLVVIDWEDGDIEDTLEMVALSPLWAGMSETELMGIEDTFSGYGHESCPRVGRLLEQQVEESMG